MVENFKIWINSMLCIGIFTLFIQLFIPKNSLKKYIYSLLGIVTILSVISPITNLFQNQIIEEGVNEVINNISNIEVSSSIQNDNINKYQNINQLAVKSGFIQKIETDIIQKLKNNQVEIEEIEVLVNEKYEIEKIEIEIKEYGTKLMDNGNISNYISQEYDIPLDRVNVWG